MTDKIDENLFRSLDIRGAEPEYIKAHGRNDSAHGALLDENAARIIGRSIAAVFKPKRVVVGHDTRNSSLSLSKSLIRGLRESGIDVDFMGLSSTDQLYWAVGRYEYAVGIEVTGSHTIKHLNGFKVVRYKNGKVIPVARGLSMERLRDAALLGIHRSSLIKGSFKKIDIKNEFQKFILSFFDFRHFKSAKVVFDAGNGMAGLAYGPIIDKLPIEAVKLNFKPDGNFPHHEPDPIVHENNHQLVQKIKDVDADFGIAWDGDADRIAVITSEGELVTGSFMAPLLIPWVLRRHPHANIIATISMSHAIREKAAEENAKVVISPVGNSHVTLNMDLHDSPFAAEEADHFMFAETFSAESGILPLLIILDEIKRTGKSFDRLLLEAKCGYYASGDVNIAVDDTKSLFDHLLGYYQAEGIASRVRFGDLEVDMERYHFALHPSYNDPVVRLNLEAKSEHDMIRGVIEVKKLINEMKV